MSDLNLSDLRDAMQAAINATTALWYATSEAVERGKVLHTTVEDWPESWIFPPDDLPSPLPPGARHLREYAPTRAELAERSRQWLRDRPPIEYYEPELLTFKLHRRRFI